MNQQKNGKAMTTKQFWDYLNKSIPADKIFITGTRNYSYKKLSDDIKKTSSFLEKNKIVSGDTVLLITSHEYYCPQIFLSCFFNGVCSVILDTEIKHDLLQSVIIQTNPKMIFCESDKLNQVTDFQIPVIRLQKDQPKKGSLIGKLLGKEKTVFNDNCLQDILESSSQSEPTLEGSDKNAYVLYTSGTTSSPKGVMISQNNLMSHLGTLSEYFDYSSTDKVLNILPYHHVDGFVQGPILCCFNGSTLIRPFTFSIAKSDELFNTVRLNKITHMITVPTLLSLLYPFYEDEGNVFKYPEFKFIVSAAGKLETNLWSNFQTKFSVTIANLFGLTESVTGSLFCGPKAENYKLGSIGKPVDCDVKIIDDNLNEIHSINTVGELCLKGDHIMSGYISNEKATGEILQNGWLHTGDLVRKDEEGFYWLSGRKKSVIIRGGINIYPEEISEVLNSFEEIKESVSLGIDDDMWGEQVVSCIVLKKPDTFLQDVIYEKLRSHLPSEKIPNRIIELKELPKGPSGKIQLDLIKEILLAKADETDKAALDQNDDNLKKLFQLASEVFKVPSNTINLSSSPENTPGWDSLGHMELVSSIEKTFAIKLSMKEVMKIECLENALTIISGKVK